MKKTTFLILLLIGTVTKSFSQASVCEDAVAVTLPYSTTADTADYGNIYSGSPGNSSCGTPNNFLNGNDVVYAYNATFTGSINLLLSTADSYVGLFAYGSCDDIGQECLAAAVMEDVNSDGYISIEAFPVSLGETYYFLVSTWSPPQTAVFHLDIAANTCANATVAYTVVSDCSVTPQFFVAIDIESLGSANSLTVSDDQESAVQNVTTEGVVTFGPYPNGTSATFTIANNQDPNCFLTSAPQTQAVCAPINNLCTGAIDLGTKTSPLNGTTTGSTNQNNTSCSSSLAAGDVYYKISVPNASTLTIGLENSNYDSVVNVFIGDCDNLIELSCSDEGDFEFIYFNNSGSDKTFYWVQDGFNGHTGTFTLAWSLSDCVTPEALYTVVPDCENGEQFLVIADVYTLGSATSVTISDDQGSDTQSVTETGLLSFGPYPNGTPVIFTATNDDDATCFLDSQEVVQYDCPPTCTNATVTYEITLNCPNDDFFVNAHVSDLGSATSVTIDDNQASDSQTVSATGTYQFGPYPAATVITFTLSNDQDDDCVVTNEVQSYSVCPPANDNCSAAIALNPGLDFAAGSLLTTNEGGTVSPELPIPSCGNMFFSSFAKDVWYTVTVPASGSITIETAASNEGGFAVVTDSVIQVYSGTCAELVPISCDNDGGGASYSLVSVTGATAGDILYIRAFGANGTQGSFKISAYDASLSAPSFDEAGIKFYPNPVKDILYLSYRQGISDVAVYNVLGQQVMTKFVNSNLSQIDMSALSKGTYLIKVNVNNQVFTTKVIKD